MSEASRDAGGIAAFADETAQESAGIRFEDRVVLAHKVERLIEVDGVQVFVHVEQEGCQEFSVQVGIEPPRQR